jgi:hypothetical protein
VLLIRELSKVTSGEAKQRAIPLILGHIQTLGEISCIDTFKNSIHLAESIFKCLTDVVQAVGKQKFRPFLDDPTFIDNTFRNSKHENNNRALSSQTFIVELGKVFGDSIFRAVLSMVDENYVSLYMQYKSTPTFLPHQQPYQMHSQAPPAFIHIPKM